MGDIDVEEIVAQIRSRVASRRADSSQGMPVQEGEDLRRTQMTADLETLQATYDLARAPVVSHRVVVGAILVGIKRLLGALLAPFLGQQVVYNAANARFTRDLADDVSALDRRLETLARAHQEQGWQLTALGDEWRAALRAETATLRGETRMEATALRVETGALREELATAREALARETWTREALGDRVHQLVESLLALKDRMLRAENQARQGVASTPARAENGHLDSLAFARQFRGGEGEIRERQRIYLPYFSGHPGEIIDLGCGRGEFLELLREAGRRARGIELDLDLAALCRDKQLEVAEDEFFTHLAGLPDGSLAGVFSAQVVEHFEGDDIVSLVKLIHEKLGPGGVIVLETINPECLWTFAATFYIDLTHRRPVHAKALRFVLECAGFQEVEVRYLAPVDAALHIPLLDESMLADGPRGRWNESITTLNTLLFGPQEYAVIGRKARP